MAIACGASLLIAAVVAVVVASRNRHQPAPPPEVPVAQAPAEVRVKAVERKTEPVEQGEVAAASGAVAIVCGEDAATADRYEARNDALRSIARRRDLPEDDVAALMAYMRRADDAMRVERVAAATNVEGQAMTRTYAVGGVVSSETRFDGSEVAYGYDADGSLASVAFPGETLSFAHDADGLLVSASNSVGVVSNAYDAATGWLMASRGVDGTTVEYTRRNGGGVASATSVAGTTSYTCDAVGRWTRAETPCGAFGFGRCGWNGQLSSVTNANGLVAEYAYDVMDRVTNIAWRTTGGASLGGFAYEYDAVGRIVARRHSLGDPSSPSQSSQKTYAYDVMDRLASDGGVEYTYDAAGNRMTKTENGETVIYTLGEGDRLVSYGRARSPSAPQLVDVCGVYSYDAAGNVTQIVRDGRPTLDLVWNGQYQLVSVATNGVFAEGYAYDALGRRAATTTREGTTRHVYDEGWQVIADIDGQGNVLASYVWGEGIDRLLAVRIGGESYYPLTDVQGTVWGYVDSQNNIVARWQYDAWGNVVDESVSVPALAALRYRFQGREWSAATGLTNFRMRWYDSVTGRWLSKDPIGLGGGLNLYAFCNGNPVNYLDVEGTLFAPFLMNPWAVAGMVAVGALLYSCAEAMVKTVSSAVDKAVKAVEEVAHTAIEMGRGALHRPGERGKTAKPDGTPNPDKHLKKKGGVWGIVDQNGKWKPTQRKPSNSKSIILLTDDDEEDDGKERERNNVNYLRDETESIE